MHISLDVTYMYTNFGGCDLSGFRDIATFKNGHIVHGHHKIQLLRIGSKKTMQLGVHVTYIHTNYGGCDFSSFGDIAISKTANFPFRPMGYSPWSSKYSIA